LSAVTDRGLDMKRTAKGAPMSPITSPHLFDELDHRSNDGIDVSLLWNRDDGGLVVLLVDTKSDEILELAAAPEQALDVFNHPYAHAAFRGLDLGTAGERIAISA
jgi:hypothetical protein